jgi:hypothetical protein
MPIPQKPYHDENGHDSDDDEPAARLLSYFFFRLVDSIFSRSLIRNLLGHFYFPPT